jgi:rhodanese-related sulfurtransferase
MKQVQSLEALKLAEDTSTFLLDVRTQREFDAHSLKRAYLLPVDQLTSRLDELPQNKNAVILVYCAHGVRSLTAIKILEQNGYTNLFNLTGGISTLT